MIPQRAHIFATTAAVLFACGSVALLAGCKGNTTSAASGGKHTTEPPSVTVLPTTADPRTKDPLTDKIWKDAPWHKLVLPANVSKSTPAVRAAMLYDSTFLYVAFVSDTVPPPAGPIATDIVSVYLDTALTESEQGKEIAQVLVSSTGQYQCNWIRATTAAKPREDGSPDTVHPHRTIPNQVVPGLMARTGVGVENGAKVWTAVVAIPVMSLKTPLQQPLLPGMKWKINLLRSISTTDVGMGAEHLQANLSPVHVGAQAVSPYRMAKLLLAEPVGK